MYKGRDYIYDATAHLTEITGADIQVYSNRKEYDALITINGTDFIVEAKAEVRATNKATILADVRNYNSKKPIIIIAKYIALDIAVEFKEKGINYIDVAGNCFIKHKDLFIYVSGQKIQRISKTNQSRAFQEAGIKLIFNLLKSPDTLQLSYRELARRTDISIGSVSNVMKELEELNFLLKTNEKRILKNTNELLSRWVVAYHDVLKPRILRKRMRFSNPNDYKNWYKIQLTGLSDINLWGGEPGAALITGKLKPAVFLIFTNSTWQFIAKKLKLIPDEEGEVEIDYMFWKEEKKSEKPVAPALLIYADLITSGFDRNTQIAQNILSNELQYIK